MKNKIFYMHNLPLCKINEIYPMDLYLFISLLIRDFNPLFIYENEAAIYITLHFELDYIKESTEAELLLDFIDCIQELNSRHYNWLDCYNDIDDGTVDIYLTPIEVDLIHLNMYALPSIEYLLERSIPLTNEEGKDIFIKELLKTKLSSYTLTGFRHHANFVTKNIIE